MAAQDGPAAAGIEAGHFPAVIVEPCHVAGAPRRVRAMVGGDWLFDTRRAFYVWEHPYYPQYYVPLADVRAGALVDDGQSTSTDQGQFAERSVRLGGVERSGAARVLVDPTDDALIDTVRFEWSAIDHWFEEDEEIFVHPRNPYARIDALRSSVPVRIELDGVVLADAPGSVTLYETGLPPRRYLAKPAIRWEHLSLSDTVSECPYKGTTSGYWHAEVGGRQVDDIAWGYDFPTREAQPIASMVAFYDDKVDVFLDGQLLD